MKEKIRSAVKTAYAKFGLKADTIEKIVNNIEVRISAMGTIENEDDVIKSEVTAVEAYVSLIQSEVDSRVKTTLTQPVKPQETQLTQNPENNPTAEEMPKWAKDLQARLDAKEQSEKATADRTAFVATIKATKGFENEKVREMLLSEVNFDMSKTTDENTTLFKTKYDKYCSEFGNSDVIPSFGSQPGSSAITAEQAEAARKARAEATKGEKV